MRLIAPEPDHSDHYEVLVDPDAEPVDADEIFVQFAIRFLDTTPAGASPADRQTNTEAKGRR